MTKPSNVAAIERSTGRDWSTWFAMLSQAGATSREHADIARLARDAMPEEVTNPDWWAQGVAIAFEQQTGMRVPGQSSTGSFRVSASRTVELDRDAAIEAWASLVGSPPSFREHECGEARHSRTPKRSFWRVDVAGAGRVEVAATPKAGDSEHSEKSVLAVNHEGLPDAESVEAWRTHWKALLAKI